MAATRINKQGGRVTLVWLAALSSVISVLWCGRAVLWRNQGVHKA